jgi:flagellar basal body-associated protein FliL
MTLTWVAEHSVGLGWIAITWAGLIFAVGGALYRRWLRHESADKAETERKLKLVKPNVITDHSQDIV